MHTQKKRVSLRERERKRERDAGEKDATKKSAESAIYVFKRAPPRRARREKKKERRESGRNDSLFP
jgi:hypothetical protein